MPFSGVAVANFHRAYRQCLLFGVGSEGISHVVPALMMVGNGLMGMSGKIVINFPFFFAYEPPPRLLCRICRPDRKAP